MQSGAAFTDYIIGTAIVISAFCAKAPQILQLYETQSTECICLASVMMDVISLTIFTSYLYRKGHHFNEWGDSGANSLATFLLCLEVLFVDKETARAVLLAVSYVVVSIGLMSGVTPIALVALLECIMIPVGMASKLMQAWTNYNERSTGQISGVTTLMLFCGAVIKTIGTYRGCGDVILIANAMASAIGNGIIGLQILYYKNSELECLNNHDGREDDHDIT
ncbi:hypothetical protein FQR65_LT04559 [Abscondita terminalis]|nr:hypothetical protein FQR65_LT04559 [Abscondita terminalis]